MSRIGIGDNVFQPNKECLKCKYWKSAKKDFDYFVTSGRCTAGYCKKNYIGSKYKK